MSKISARRLWLRFKDIKVGVRVIKFMGLVLGVRVMSGGRCPGGANALHS